MNERTEILTKIATARKILEAAAAELRLLETSKGDIGEISDDAFRELVAMMHELNTDYCVETLAQDALAYEADAQQCTSAQGC